ncbi:ROK family protein [Streptomyces abyssomicinicus]|uniref:ROK family protein n=1 Tax=Streptomyces abyssomicinicus TaxID=574929 RepID=UPI00124FEFF8|nr:ROK family protein [Streptomyces abyssomicinicus]
MPEGHRGYDCVLALDVGGTALKAALVGRDLALVPERRRTTPRAEGADAVVDAMTETLCGFARRAASLDLTVRRAGVVVPGVVDEQRRTVLHSANLRRHDLPLADLLEARTRLPVTLGHDVRAAGAAECALGARAVVVSSGPDGLQALTPDGGRRAAPPERLVGNPTGAGDAGVAALATGLADGRRRPDILREAVALSAAAVPCSVASDFDAATCRRTRPDVSVEAIHAPHPH